jgi:hypothetical protein
VAYALREVLVNIVPWLPVEAGGKTRGIDSVLPRMRGSLAGQADLN